VILTLVGQVANNYLTLRALDEQLAVAQKTLVTYNESLKLFELQFKYGVVSQMNVAQAKSQSQTRRRRSRQSSSRSFRPRMRSPSCWPQTRAA